MPGMDQHSQVGASAETTLMMLWRTGKILTLAWQSQLLSSVDLPHLPWQWLRSALLGVHNMERDMLHHSLRSTDILHLHK
jgi:hypothetical protein